MITPGSSETKIIPSITNLKLSFMTGKFPKRYPPKKETALLRVKKSKNTS